MFGDLDFRFVYQDIKFVFLNTNSLEFAYNGNVPNFGWFLHHTFGSEYWIKLPLHYPA